MIVAAIVLLHTIIAPSPVIHTGAAQHTKIDRVTAIRVKRAELPRSAWNYALRVSSPYGTLNDKWLVCSKQNTRCFTAIQVDVSHPRDRAYQLKTQAGLEVDPRVYPLLGCNRKAQPKFCRVTIRKVQK